MLKRLLLGLVKGLLVGGALGAAAHSLIDAHTLTGIGAYFFYALVGGLAGLVAGRPAWRTGAGVAAILRAVFGLGVGVGLYALAAAFLKVEVGIPGAAVGAAPALLVALPVFLAPMIATVYAVLVELDDGGENPEPVVKSKVRIDVDDIKVDEEEVPAQKGAASAKARKG